MKVIVNSNRYENGKRVSEQTVTYDKSDDLYTLANLQRRYEAVCEQAAIAAAENEEVPAHLVDSMASIKAELEEMQALVDGYKDTEEQA